MNLDPRRSFEDASLAETSLAETSLANLSEFWLKVSRPGLWFQTVWLYVLPTSTDSISQFHWWIGLFFVTWPLNLLVYGWNDFVDYEIDQENPRKDSFLFGARGTRKQLRTLIWFVPAVWILCGILFWWIDQPRLILILSIMVASISIYNLPWTNLRGRPPFDLLNPVAYLLVIWFAIELNQTSMVPWQTYFYLALFCIHAQLIGEVMDFYPDVASGRTTTCTLIGIQWTKVVIIALVIFEGILLCWWFHDYVLGIGLLAASIGLLVDLFVSQRHKYSRTEFNLMGYAMNVAGLASMLWVWITQSLSSLPSE